MLLLLDHNNYELLYSICGTLINFTGERDRREALVQMGGVTSLIELLDRVVALAPADPADIEVRGPSISGCAGPRRLAGSELMDCILFFLSFLRC